MSISDLLASPKDRASLAGHGPVVINLSTSTAHIGPPPKGMLHFDGLHLYQIRRGPEDQPQYLLRLGIIASDIEADAILSSVLEHYPGATKASPEDDDHAAIAAQAEAAASAPKHASAPVPHSKPPTKPAPKHPEARHRAPKAAPAATAEPIRWDIDELLPDLAMTRPSEPQPAATTEAPRVPAKNPATPSAPAARAEQPAAPPPAAVRAEQPELSPPPADASLVHAKPTPELTVRPMLESVAEVQAPAPSVAEVVQTFEFTLSAPEPAAAPARPVAHKVELNYDSDAVTHEVPLPTFEFDAPASPVLFAQPGHEEPPTLEVPVAPVVHEEPQTLEVQAAQAAYEEPPTLELQAAQVAYDEPLTIEVRAAVVLAVEGHISRLTAVETPVPVIAVEARGAEPAASVAPASAMLPARAVDTAAETLEQLVAKIDAMVGSVDQHEKERPEPSIAPRIDSTQTLRALTALELADDESSPWFSIQLAFSEEQIDPEQVPDLDLFSEYRLYSVTGLHQDRIMHSLRLGFFSSELAAEAVAGYLRGFFDAPCIKRVSVAERERFAEKSMTARKDIGATGVHAVIELTSPKALPERQARGRSKPASEAAQSSIWSRLVAPLRR